MSLETDLQALTAATTALTASVNVRKAVLDEKVSAATEKSDVATTKAGEATQAAASALAIYGNTVAMSNAVSSASSSQTSAATSAASAASSATQAAASAASASAIVLGVASGYPAIRPSLNLDFANSKVLDPRITFSRASTATYYDGRTVAKAEENLLTYSQDFGNGSWTKLYSSANVNAGVSPDGSISATFLVEDSTNNPHGVQQSSSLLVSQYAYSVYAKAGSRSWLQLINGSVANCYAYFNLASGLIGTIGSGATASISSIGNGWYRCSIVFTASPGSNGLISRISTGDNSSIYTGDGISGIYLWGSQLEQRSSATAYTSTTSTPITNYIPVLQTAVAGAPRFDHDPITGESKGFLIEEQRTNFLAYSSDIDNAAWYKSAASVVANFAVAPDGTATADVLIESTTSGIHQVYRFPGLGVSTYTCSFYAKANGRTQIVIDQESGGAARFTLTGSGAATALGSNNATITHIGNGWYRCTNTFTATGVFGIYLQLHNGTTVSYAGDGYSGVYIWGAQIELGSFPTSYIPTTSAQATRAADAASMTGVNFSSWYRPGEGCFYAEYQYPTASAARYVLSGGDISNQRWIYGNAGSSNMQIYDGSTAAVIGSSNQTTYNKAAVFSAYGVIGGSLNGSAVVSQSTNYYLARDTNLLIIGDGNNKLNGCIKSIRYYPKRLSNSELQALTA